MSGNPQYHLWFVNESANAGKACVYHGAANATCSQANPSVLAWMVGGANPSVSIHFTWSTDYSFVWFDHDSPASQQIIAANLTSANSVTLALNAYGYYFSSPSENNGLPGQFSVQANGTIPSCNQTVTGIGMHGAGTFAVGASPNTRCLYTPAQDANLVYWISFGNYTFDANAELNLDTMNPPGKIIFPYGIYTMTAVLNADNTWTIYEGEPGPGDVARIYQVRVYEAGKGLLP